MTNNKKVQLDLVGCDDSAFAILGAFSKAARRQKWTKEEIDAVVHKATEGDYNHLLATIMDYCS